MVLSVGAITYYGGFFFPVGSTPSAIASLASTRSGKGLRERTKSQTPYGGSIRIQPSLLSDLYVCAKIGPTVDNRHRTEGS